MSNFTFLKTAIEDLFVIEPKVFGDARGFFLESYRESSFHEAGILTAFVQDNHSMSGKGVLRGLHFQIPHWQAKLVRVLKGSVYDVAVDLREGSPTRFHWHGEILSAENKRMMYLPDGFAHGFLTLEDDTHFLYKAGELYRPEDDGGIRFDDPDLAIQWPNTGSDWIISEKDRKLPMLKEWIASR